MNHCDFTFGQRLRYLRVSRNMTQKELGICCGFPENTSDIRIRQYESDKRRPKINIMKLIAKKLNSSVEMLSMESNDTHIGTDNRKLIVLPLCGRIFLPMHISC